MPTLPADYELKNDQREDPIVWVQMGPLHELGKIRLLDVSDHAMERYLGKGNSMKLKSFGHDELGLHFLLTRNGTTVHTDPAYARFTHQLVLRNDGNRLRGLPKNDHDPARHPLFEPGVMYCLDTHSPHQGWVDTRFPGRKPTDKPGMKAVIAFDRNHIVEPDEAWAMFRPWLGRQFSDVEFDPTKYAAPKWKDTTSA